nr:MAG TPA: hypothetical protein [Caudoviricetes sp.]
MVNIQDSLSGKTLQEHLVALTGTTFEPCLKKSDKATFQCLESGQHAEWQDFRSATSHGESLTLSIGESPNVAVESSLSQILQPQEDVPQKYFLSKRGCLGILRRAAVKNKTLPMELEQALKEQAV